MQSEIDWDQVRANLPRLTTEALNEFKSAVEAILETRPYTKGKE